MQIRELTSAQCRAMLEATNLGRLACVRYNRPYIVPIYFDYYVDALYSFATVGKKIQWMRTNPLVCVEIDEIVDRFNWTTVVVTGRYEELTKSPAHQAARKRAYLLFENRPDWWYPAAGKTRSSVIRTPVIYRIQIEGMTGRRAARDPEKVARARPAPAATKAPGWWSQVLRPLQGPPARFK
jgi:uncharacterized protein